MNQYQLLFILITDDNAFFVDDKIKPLLNLNRTERTLIKRGFMPTRVSSVLDSLGYSGFINGARNNELRLYPKTLNLN